MIADLSLAEADLDLPPFFDLRHFALGHAPAPSLPSAVQGEGFYQQRRCLFRTDDTEVGAIDLPAGLGLVRAQAADEFVFVCRGSLRLNHAGGTIDLAENACAVLTRGVEFSWYTGRPTTLVYMRYGAPASQAARVLPIDTCAELQASGAPLAELLLSAAPSCRNHTDYRSVDGVFTCGTWDSTPYQRKPMRYGHSELMHLLQGSVTLEDESGHRQTFQQDDLFVVRKGVRCAWDSREQVKKVYAIVRPV